MFEAQARQADTANPNKKSNEPNGALLLLKDKVFALYEEALDTRDQCFDIMETNAKNRDLLNQATGGLRILKDLEWKINRIPDNYHGAKKTKVADVFNDNLTEYLNEVSPMLEVCHAPHDKTKLHISEFRKLLTDWEAERQVVDGKLSIRQFKDKPETLFVDYGKQSESFYNYKDHVLHADDFIGYKSLWDTEPKQRRFRDVDGDYYFAKPETATNYYIPGPEKTKLSNEFNHGKGVAAAGGFSRFDSFRAGGSRKYHGAGGERKGPSKGAVAGGVVLMAVFGILGYKAYHKYTNKE